jgi:sugar lactone lactonase YvrE
MRLAKLVSLAVSSLTAGLLAWGMAGCGSSVGSVDTNPIAGGPYSGVTFGGKAMAGKQPLIGASVQLFAAGTTGNGIGNSSLLTAALTTDANGAFTVPAGYACPSSASQLYFIARGGKPGPSATSANSAIVLATTIGACSQVIASSQIVINEVTTVAAVYSLSQFLSPGANLGASSTNSAGLQNSVATATALADITQGASPGPTFAANGSSPATRINSLANLLNACVASTTATPCTTLFTATTLGASVPTNTLDAALNLTRAPSANVAGLYTLSTTSSAFTPVLAAAPADWTLFVNYTGGGMNLPTGLGIDGAGNVWVSSYFSSASLFSPLGKPIFPQGITGFGLSASYGLAVDASNNAWIPNEPNAPIAGNSVTVLNSTGQSVAGSAGYTAGGLNFPIAIAIDTDASAWVLDYGNSHLAHLASSGQALSGSAGYTSQYLALPDSGAVDSSHNLWVANQAGASVTKVSPDGSQFTNFLCCDEPAGIAIDRLGNAWVTNFYSNSISEISSAGVILSNQAYLNGGLNHPQGIAIDGAGNVWITNYRGPTLTSTSSLTELAGATAATPGAALSASTGLGTDANMLEAFCIAVDAGGNLWITNSGNNHLTEFIGLAAPVRTPLIGLPAAP